MTHIEKVVGEEGISELKGLPGIDSFVLLRTVVSGNGDGWGAGGSKEQGGPS